MRTSIDRRPRRRRIVLIATTVAAVSVIAASTAIALKAAKQRQPIESKTFGTAVAKCGKERIAVSGGFATPHFDPASGPSIGRLGFKRASRREIKTRGYNFGDVTGDLVSYAYCARHGHGFKVRSASTGIAPATEGSAVAKCPAGTIVVGGGFDANHVSRANGPGVLTLTSKRQSQRAWKAAGVNIPPDNGTGARGALTVYAYCEKAPFKLQTVSKDFTPPVNGLLKVDVHCPDGRRVFSGGFDGHVRLTPQPSGTAAVTSRRAPGAHGWRIGSISVFDSGPGTATGFAYCRINKR